MKKIIFSACCYALLTTSISNADEYSSFANVYAGNANFAGSSSPCASGNCPLTNSHVNSIAMSSHVVQSKEPKGRSIGSEDIRGPQDSFVTHPLHDIARPVLVEKQPPWVQPESEILDSQPGVDPYDVGCGPEPDEPTAFQTVVTTAKSDVPNIGEATYFTSTQLESVPNTSLSTDGSAENRDDFAPIYSYPAFISGGCATGNCPLRN